MLQQIAQKIMACCRRLCGGKKAVVVLSEVSLFDGNIGGYFCFLHRDLKRQKKNPHQNQTTKTTKKPQTTRYPHPKTNTFSVAVLCLFQQRELQIQNTTLVNCGVSST